VCLGHSRSRLGSVDASWTAAPGNGVAHVVERTIDRIAVGELASGDRVSEPFLERAFGASRYTVREALRVLVTQGVLEKSPFSGCRVTVFDEARLRQIYLARLQIELLALPDAIDAIAGKPELLERLDAALADLVAAAADGDDRGYAAADLAFHLAVCEVSGNAIACRLWQTLLPHVRIVRAVLGERVTDVGAHVEEHRRLRDAIATADSAAAEQLWRAHLVAHLRLAPLSPGCAATGRPRSSAGTP